MHNLSNYGSDIDSTNVIIQEAELTAIDYLKPGQNDELFNKLKQGARMGATMLSQMAQDNDLTITEVYEHSKAKIDIPVNKKLKR